MARLKALAAAIVMGIIGATAFATPASALVYLYEDEYFNGGKWSGTSNYTYHDGDKFNNDLKLYDEVSSIENFVSYYTCFYNNHHYLGDWIRLPPQNAQLNVGSVHNDELSSHLMGAPPGC